jgi:hypothetical protein
LYNLTDDNDLDKLVADGHITQAEKKIFQNANSEMTNLFGYNVERSTAVICEDQTDFLEKVKLLACFKFEEIKRNDPQAFYEPLKRRVFVQKRNKKISLSDIFHEYYGHGIFCEKSKLGRAYRLKEAIRFEINNNTPKRESIIIGLFNSLGFSFPQIRNCVDKTIINSEGVAIWVDLMLNIKVLSKEDCNDRMDHYLTYITEPGYDIALEKFVGSDLSPVFIPINIIKTQMGFKTI